MDKCFQDLNEFNEGGMLDGNLNTKIPACKGKPLIWEKNKMINYLIDKPAFQVGLAIHKTKKEYKPQKPFDEMREGMADVGNGMFKKTLIEGFGETVKEDTKISVHYTMFLENDDCIHDTSYVNIEPFEFVLGRYRGILPWFERALRTMRNQEKAEFIVPRLLSAENGKCPKEDERKTGYLVIEVLRVVDIVAKKEKARLLNNFDETVKQVEELREKGRAAFVAGFFRLAGDMYTQAVHKLKLVLVQTQADNKKRLELLMRMYLNTGIILNKLNLPGPAISMLEPAVDIFTNTDIEVDKTLKGKILLHASRSYRLEKKLSTAYLYLSMAQKNLGDVKDIRDEFNNLSQAYEDSVGAMSLLGSIGENMGTSRDDDAADDEEDDMTCYNEDFKATFNHMLRTFLCSKEKKKIVFGQQNISNWAMAVVMVMDHKKKVKIDVLKQSEHTCCYILTKK